MSDDSKAKNLREVWADQPREKLEMNIQSLVNRRTRDIYASTRADILSSIIAAIFFASFIAWRLPFREEPVLQAGVSLVLIWTAITFYKFRDRILHPGPADSFASSGVEHYRRELQARLEHLRNAWIWHGPVALACITFMGFVGRAWPRALPFLVLLAIWIVAAFVLRRRRARDLQREIDEIT